jgi:hypothetical protein
LFLLEKIGFVLPIQGYILLKGVFIKDSPLSRTRLLFVAIGALQHRKLRPAAPDSAQNIRDVVESVETEIDCSAVGASSVLSRAPSLEERIKQIPVDNYLEDGSHKRSDYLATSPCS